MPSPLWVRLDELTPTHECSNKCCVYGVNKDRYLEDTDTCPLCRAPLVRMASSTRINIMLSSWVQDAIATASVNASLVSAKNRRKASDDRLLDL